jgi:hypothetical protein
VSDAAGTADSESWSDRAIEIRASGQGQRHSGIGARQGPKSRKQFLPGNSIREKRGPFFQFLGAREPPVSYLGVPAHKMTSGLYLLIVLYNSKISTLHPSIAMLSFFTYDELHRPLFVYVLNEESLLQPNIASSVLDRRKPAESAQICSAVVSFNSSNFKRMSVVLQDFVITISISGHPFHVGSKVRKSCNMHKLEQIS